jgi:hypothetical protein
LTASVFGSLSLWSKAIIHWVCSRKTRSIGAHSLLFVQALWYIKDTLLHTWQTCSKVLKKAQVEWKGNMLLMCSQCKRLEIWANTTSSTPKTWLFGIYLNFQRQKSPKYQYLPHSESKSYQINSIKSCSSRSFQ